jgi:carbamoyl-phosphate synthase small subunit
MPNGRLTMAREFPGLERHGFGASGQRLAPYEWSEGVWQLADNRFPNVRDTRYHVVAYDYGVKRNILRMLAMSGCRVTVVPAQMPAREVMALNPDGVFLSNGPGDPEPCDYAIAAIRELLEVGVPLFGICLGHQLLGWPAARAPSR